MTGPLLELDGVGKRYRRGAARSVREVLRGGGSSAHWEDVLRGVDLQLGRGDVIGVVGRNGGGKSTLLRLAAGLTMPSSGVVRRAASVSGLLTLGAASSVELTARDNAITAAVLAGLTPRQARARIADIAQFAELEEFLDEPLRTFSDGMRVRLAFAAAVHTDPQLLLVDEVLAVGDLAFQEKCLDHISRLRDEGCGVLVASHVLGHLRRVCTGVIWLRDGVVHRRGGAAEVLEAYSRSTDDTAGPAVRAEDGAGERKGSGEARLVRLTVQDDQGRDVQHVSAGAAVRLVLTYERRDPSHRAAQAGIALRPVGGDSVLVDITTGGSGGAVQLQDHGRLVLDLARLDLAPGAYWVDCGLYSPDWELCYDYRWDWRRLLIVGPSATGPVQPPYDWSVG